MKKIYYIFVLHAVLLILAATDFSIISFLLDKGGVNYDLYTLSYQIRRGRPYKSDYELMQIITYFFSYAAGFGLYRCVSRRGAKTAGFIGSALCAFGMISFGFEASHWIVRHNYSLIVSCPIAFIPLWIIALVKIAQRPKL